MAILPELCSIQYGYAFDSTCFTEDSTYLPLVRIRDVKRGYSETFYSGNHPNDYIIDNGSLLVGMDGEFNIARWKGGKALLNQRVCKITARKNVDEEYLRFALTKALKEIENRTSFVTVKHLSAKELNRLEIDIPDYRVQISISGTLTKIENIIFTRQQQLQKLDELVKARFVELFGDCKSMVSMNELCSIITDGTHQPPRFQESGIPFIFVSNLVGNVVTYNAEKFISEDTYAELYKRTPIEIGDLLLSTVGSYGHPAVVTEDRKFLFQRHIAYLKPRHNMVNSFYLHSALLAPDGQRQIEEKVKGIAQKTLNLSEIKKIVVPLPTIEEQNQFEQFVNRVDKSKLSPYRDCWTRCNFCLAVWCDNTSNKEDIMEWLMNLDPSIWAALIGAVGAIIVALIKVIIPLFKKKEKVSDKISPTINQTVTGNGNTVIGIQNNMKGEKDGQ